MSSLLKQNTTDLQELLNEINNLPTYLATTDATAAAGEILSGKTAYVKGSKVTGDMANNGAMSKTMDGINTKSVSIPAGYTSGGSVSLDNTIDNAVADAIAALVEKEVEVPDGTGVTGLAALITAIEVGGGLPDGITQIATGTYTLSSDAGQSFAISHGMGVVPKWAIVWTEDTVEAPIGFAALSTIYNSLGAGLHARKSEGALKYNSLSGAWTKNGCLSSTSISPCLANLGTSAYAGTTFKWVAWV